jgi:hypothetical protein
MEVERNSAWLDLLRYASTYTSWVICLVIRTLGTPRHLIRGFRPLKKNDALDRNCWPRGTGVRFAHLACVVEGHD